MGLPHLGKAEACGDERGTSRHAFVFILGMSLFLGIRLDPVFAQQVFINEIQAGNRTVLADAYGEHDDWVELYNPGTEGINLAGYYLTDNLNEETYWQIPDSDPHATTIRARGYLLFWFDGTPEQGPTHVGARLSRNGEQVGLIAPDGITVIDAVTFPVQHTDISFGRASDGQADWRYFEAPTPGQPNPDTGWAGIAEVPLFGQAPGGYTGPQVVHLSSATPDALIFYSQDGSEPDEIGGTLYTGPLTLTKTTVIRARAYAPDLLPSAIQTGTFLINEFYPYMTVSVTTAPENLWSDEAGIYVEGNSEHGNYFQDWERPAYAEFFDPSGVRVEAQEIDLSMWGGVSRTFPKKPLKLSARGGKLNYPFFEDKPDLTAVGGVLLDTGIQDYSFARNQVFYSLNRAAGGHIDMQAYRSVMLLLNGEYWGWYNLTERRGADYIQSNYDVGDIDLLRGDGTRVQAGSNGAYLGLLERLNTLDMQAPEAFDEINRLIDTDNLIDYWIFWVYAGRDDNPVDKTKSIRFWRPQTSEGRWRWILYDLDQFTEVEVNILADILSHTEAEGLWLLGRLVQNPTFRDRFVFRFTTLLHTVLTPAHVIEELDRMEAELTPGMPFELARWGETHWFGRGMDFAFWQWTIERQRLDAVRRHEFVWDHLAATLGVERPVQIDGTTAGLVASTGLGPGYPNPFHAVSIWTYQLARPGDVYLEVYTVTGQRVRVLAEGRREAGLHRLQWKPKGVSAGMYWMVLRVDGTVVETQPISFRP